MCVYIYIYIYTHYIYIYIYIYIMYRTCRKSTFAGRAATSVQSIVWDVVIFITVLSYNVPNHTIPYYTIPSTIPEHTLPYRAMIFYAIKMLCYAAMLFYATMQRYVMVCRTGRGGRAPKCRAQAAAPSGSFEASAPLFESIRRDRGDA